MLWLGAFEMMLSYTKYNLKGMAHIVIFFVKKGWCLALSWLCLDTHLSHLHGKLRSKEKLGRKYKVELATPKSVHGQRHTLNYMLAFSIPSKFYDVGVLS